MKAAEVREMDTEELHGRISELKEELFNLRFQGATGQLDNHRRMRTVKQDVARIRTILRERDFATAEAAGTPVPPARETAPVTAPETREQAPEPAVEAPSETPAPEVPLEAESTDE